ncbi:hypothetical protein STXM2123_166 [Streptomyces sp. F-3]|nr:hypothetical protein STXM2123_166 [Streptomyces sp. F-3]
MVDVLGGGVGAHGGHRTARRRHTGRLPAPVSKGRAGSPRVGPEGVSRSNGPDATGSPQPRAQE